MGKSRRLAGILVLLGAAAFAGAIALVARGSSIGGLAATPSLAPVAGRATPEPLVPTRTPTPESVEMGSPGASDENAAATRQAPAAPAPRDALLWQGRPRWGAGVASGSIAQYDIAPLHLGWYVNWTAQADPPRPEGIEYTPMIRLKGGVLSPDAETIAAVARANPGSLWLVGNEPDSFMQDDVEPAVYARLYHEAYTAIKTADPTAQVAIGGVVQPTPLRMRYLEAILASYRQQFGVEMPIDVWNVHNFILREEEGAWGAFIPPGLPDHSGMLYEIDDCGNLAIFEQQIIDFRRWMAEHGYRNYPLIVSEYGIPMPEDYGFPPERVTAFLLATFDFFLAARDPELGYPADDYRLVQRWCWYSLASSDEYYPTGRLFDPRTGEMTEVGEGWAEYAGNLWAGLEEERP